jgi:hypothetical protein
MVKLPSIIFCYYHLLSTHVICSILYDKPFLVLIYKITRSNIGLWAQKKSKAYHPSHDDRAAIAKEIETTSRL